MVFPSAIGSENGTPISIISAPFSNIFITSFSVYSISAGLDYPGIGPEHAYLRETKRAEYVDITDEEAVCAFEYLSKTEGIIPAIESSHAVAAALKIAPTMSKDSIMVITISGRGDKDVYSIAKYRGVDVTEQ